MTADSQPCFSVEDLRRLDDETLYARFRQAVDAVPGGGSLDRPGVITWINNVSEVLHAIRPLAQGRRANLALKLAEHAIQWIAQVIDVIEYDHRAYRLIDRAQKIHLRAAKITRPSPFELARSLNGFDRTTAGYKISGYSFEAYADLLGTTGLAEFRRLTEQAWATLPTHTANTVDAPHRGTYNHLSRILDHFAKGDGDVDARIALRTKFLPTTSEHIWLVGFCLDQGRADAAIRYAEEGLQAFAGKPHVELARLTAKLLLKRGRKAEAQLKLRNGLEAAQARHVNDALSIRSLCDDLCAFGEPARNWVIARLKAKIGDAEKKEQVYLADILVGMLLDERMLEAAFNAAGTFPCSLDVKERVAKDVEQALPAQAVELYEELVRLRLAKGTWPHFSRAYDMLSHLAQVRSAEVHQDYVNRLKERFARRQRVKRFLDGPLVRGIT